VEIFLVRHTSVICEKNICYGQSDVGLATSSKNDIQSVLKKLTTQNFDLQKNVSSIYSSSLSRCRHLADAVFNSNYICDDRLMEMNFGEWELKSWDSIDRKCLDNWANDFVNIKCPSGESFKNVYDRSNEFLGELLQSDCKSAVLVTHAGVIRAILCKALGMPLNKAFNIGLDYGSVSKMTINNLIQKVDYVNR